MNDDTPTIEETGRGYWRFVVRTPYNGAYVETLKADIFPRDRRWDPDEQIWFFTDRSIELVCSLLKEFYGDFRWVRTQARAAVPDTVADSYAVLHLLPSAPESLVTAAYRILAKITHPDAGGNTAAMQRINKAKAEIDQMA